MFHARMLRILLGGVLLILAAGCGRAPGGQQPPSEPASAAASATMMPDATGTPAATETASEPAGLTSDALHTVVLRDVRNQTEFTLGQLAAEKPVLLEMMAIWCTNCNAQMHRVVEAHAVTDFHSVGIDVDASELPADLMDYVEEEGFDWPFAMASAELAGMLRDRFGNLVLNPPSTPMAILFPDGSIRQLDFRGYSVDELVAELTAP